jgi:hypothetical protein
MLFALQLLGVARMPLNLTLPVPCGAPKLAPLIVTVVPTGPELGASDVIDGAAATPPVTVTLLNEAVAAVAAVWLVTASPTYTCTGSGTVPLLIGLHVVPSIDWYPVRVVPLRATRTHRGAAPPTVWLVLPPPWLTRVWNSSPLAALAPAIA